MNKIAAASAIIFSLLGTSAMAGDYINYDTENNWRQENCFQCIKIDRNAGPVVFTTTDTWEKRTHSKTIEYGGQ